MQCKKTFNNREKYIIAIITILLFLSDAYFGIIIFAKLTLWNF